MRSTPDKPDLTILTDAYDVVGEISTRNHSVSFVGTRKQDGRDVLITVMRAADEVADGKAIAQFAADANLLVTLSHPNVPKVLEGRWIGDDAFALISERVQGTTLADQLKGDRLPNPRIADILGDVDGVLEWARGERIAHRGVTPDGIWIERGTGKAFISLSPTDAARTNRPDDHDDARTIGALAVTMLTARPVAGDHDGTLASMRPDLPQRVIDATLKLADSTMNDAEPNISAYLASLAMADAIKEGELEVARVDAEFRAAMKAEREKWEAEQLACQLAAEAQATRFAEERAEYERRTAKERDQLGSARAEIDKRRTEVQQARLELDQARAEFKRKKSELDARVREIDRHANAVQKHERELQKRARDLDRKNRELEAAAAIAATETSMEGLKARLNGPQPRPDEINRPTVPLSVVTDDQLPAADDERLTELAPKELAGGIESVEDVNAPWTPIEESDPWAEPLVIEAPASAMEYESAAMPRPEHVERASWQIPAAIAGFVVVFVVAGMLVFSHGGGSSSTLVASAPGAKQIATPDTAAIPALVTADSAGGEVVPPLSDSSVFTALRDSIDRSDERLAARRAKAAAAAAAPDSARVIRDSAGVQWTTVPPPPLDSVKRALANAAKRDSAAKSAKRDSVVRVKPDTGATRRPSIH